LNIAIAAAKVSAHTLKPPTALRFQHGPIAATRATRTLTKLGVAYRRVTRETD
jgi:hypothetical protein